MFVADAGAHLLATVEQLAVVLGDDPVSHDRSPGRAIHAQYADDGRGQPVRALRE